MPGADTSRVVRLVDVLSVLVIAPAVAWVWVEFAEPTRFSVAMLVEITAAGAATIGVPVWFWAADHGRTRLRDRLWLGGAAGLGPPLLVLASAALGYLVRGGAANVQWVFGHGAPIPAYGLLPWPVFAGFSVQSVGVGAICGAIQWAITRGRGTR